MVNLPFGPEQTFQINYITSQSYSGFFMPLVVSSCHIIDQALFEGVKGAFFCQKQPLK